MRDSISPIPNTSSCGCSGKRGALPVKDIAAALQLDYGTLSPLLKRLESAQLIQRTRRPDDERSVEITLTATGTELREQARVVPGGLACAFGLDDREMAELRATLRTLTENVSAR